MGLQAYSQFNDMFFFSVGEQDAHQHNDADADDVPRRDADRRDRLLPHVPGQKLDSRQPDYVYAIPNPVHLVR